jgi:predicted PurR-regulated permease PerM
MNALAKIRLAFIIAVSFASLFIVTRVIDVIVPFVVGAVLAYLLNPAVARLTKKGFSRQFAVFIVFSFIIFIGALIMFLVLPKLYLELEKLALVLPERIQAFNHFIETIRDKYIQAGLPSEVNKLIDEQFQESQSLLINWLEKALKNLPAILASIGLMILAPILAIYFLLDWQKISVGLIKLVPVRLSGQWQRLLQEIDYLIQRYVQGNIIDALIVGLLIGLGVKLVGMEYAFLIGVICGVTNLIPYFGPILGGIPSVLLALGKGPFMAIKVILVIIIVQQIDSNIINPRLMSNKMGLHPLWVIFALLAGGKIGGLLGMIVAIPSQRCSK